MNRLVLVGCHPVKSDIVRLDVDAPPAPLRNPLQRLDFAPVMSQCGNLPAEAVDQLRVMQNSGLHCSQINQVVLGWHDDGLTDGDGGNLPGEGMDGAGVWCVGHHDWRHGVYCGLECRGHSTRPQDGIPCRRYAVESVQERWTLDVAVHTDTGKCLPCGVLEHKSTDADAAAPGALLQIGLRPLKFSKFLGATCWR